MLRNQGLGHTGWSLLCFGCMDVGGLEFRVFGTGEPLSHLNERLRSGKLQDPLRCAPNSAFCPSYPEPPKPLN